MQVMNLGELIDSLVQVREEFGDDMGVEMAIRIPQGGWICGIPVESKVEKDRSGWYLMIQSQARVRAMRTNPDGKIVGLTVPDADQWPARAAFTPRQKPKTKEQKED